MNHFSPRQAARFLVEKGVSNFCIDILGPATPSMHHGAEELQRYLLQISGARLPIIEGPIAGSAIVLKADPTFGSEEYRIHSTSRGLEIGGGALRGVMYGCYGLLQDVYGVRWYTSRISRVPKSASLIVPDLDMRQRPAFEYREPYFTEAFDRDWAVRNRVNGNSQHLDAAVGGKISYGRFVHTFNELVPPDEYFDKHPEYFSMINGKRMKGYYQLCLTNPDVLKIAIAKVEKWIKENPDATIFSVSQNDTYGYCQCDQCRKVEVEEGAPSGPLIRFVNSVAAAIEKDHPNVLIDTLAYQWSEKPPLHVRPRKNVRIRIAPIGACFSHPLDGCAENAQPYKNLEDWSKITNNIYIWHYTTNFANYLQPLPNLDEIAGDARVFQSHGVVGFFDEGDYSPGGGGDFAELKSYLLARLMWNPNLDSKVIIQEYLDGVYGKAAPYLASWIDLTHRAGREGKAHARIYDQPNAPYLGDEVLSNGDKLFDEAEAAVKSDPVSLDQVQRARLWLEYVQLKRAKWGSPEFHDLAKRVADKLRKYGIGQVSEGGETSAFLKQIGQ